MLTQWWSKTHLFIPKNALDGNEAMAVATGGGDLLTLICPRLVLVVGIHKV